MIQLKTRRMFTAVAATAAALASVGGIGLAQAEPSAPSQFTFFDQTVSQTTLDYAMPTFTAPANWTAPVDYANGRAFVRLEVTAKPSDKLINAQICMWRGNWTIETCSDDVSLTGAGVYWMDLGSPDSWWKKNGNWSWELPVETMRIMVKDESKKLMILRRCGDACYTAGDLGQHVPITFNASMIVVANGAELDAPAGWAGCPTGWGPKCDGSQTRPPQGAPNNPPAVSVGGDLSTAGSQIDLRGFVTDDGLPNWPGSIATTWVMASGPGKVTFSAKNALRTSVSFPAAGTYELKLRANDGQFIASDSLTVTVGGNPAVTTTTMPPVTTTRPPATTTTVPSTTTTVPDVTTTKPQATTTRPPVTTTTVPASAPSVRVDDARVVEGNAGIRSLPFRITLSSPSDEPVVVKLKTGDGSARVAGGDYLRRVDTVTFAPGVTSMWFGVAVSGDRAAEGDETLKVIATVLSGASLSDGIAIGVIANDD